MTGSQGDPQQRSRASVVCSPDGRSSAMLGDCLEVLPTIADGSVDLIFADPPYNIGKKFGEFHDTWPTETGYLDWCKSWLEICLAKLSPHGALYLMASTQAMPHLDIWLRERAKILSRIVWCYDSSGKQARRYFGSLYEPILFCVRDSKNYTFNSEAIEVEAKTGTQRRLIDYRGQDPKPYNTRKVPGNVWSFPRVRFRMPEYEEHPSQKPEALLERVVLASSNPEDLVLDPFAGTFTSCAVAQRLGRRTIGIEREISYFEIGLRRLGLATQFAGRTLKKPSKSFQPRNDRGMRKPAEQLDESLFGD